MRRTLLAALTALPSLFLTSCGDADVLGSHVTLNPDGTGRITVRSLLPSKSAGPAESSAQGIQFDARANLSASSGRFGDLAKVNLGGITFERTDKSLRAILPRGPDVAWPAVLAPKPAEQERTGQTFEPNARARDFGAIVRLAFELPGDVVSVGSHPVARGVEFDKERRKAFLWVPVTTALKPGEPLTFDVSWK